MKKRWNGEAARAFVENLCRWGRSGNRHEVSESPFGKVKETSRLDLRGLVLPEQTEWRRITIRSADLSGAVLRHAWFESSIFDDVLFDNCSLQILSEGGGNFENCRFRNTNFRGAVVGYRGSRFKKCQFEQADFIQAGFIRPEFDDCLFDSCTFSGVDFKASSFERCEFRSELRGVWFHGSYELSPVIEQFANPRPNKMKSVSFKNARLIDVDFSDGCDLSSIIPPDDGRHAVFDRWPVRIRSVFEQSRAWPEPLKREGEGFCKIFEAQPYKDGTYPAEQDWYLIGEDALTNLFGKEAGKKLWDALLCT